MKFFVMMTDIEGEWDRLSPAEQDRVMTRHAEVEQALRAQGKFISSRRLRPSAEAKTVRRRTDGHTLVTDGPFTETKEAMGGYYIIDCASMDEAVEWAKRLRFIVGSNEVRPIWEDSAPVSQ